MIKTLIITSICSLIGLTSGFGQSTKSDIREDVIACLTANCDVNLDGIIKFTNPDLLKVTPATKIKSRLKHKNDKTRKYDCIDHQITDVSDEVDYSGVSYALVNVELDQTLTVFKKLSDKEHKELKVMFDGLFGEENWSQDGNVYHVKMEKQFVGDYRKGSSHWTFIDYNVWLKQAEKNAIPKTVRDQLGLK